MIDLLRGASNYPPGFTGAVEAHGTELLRCEHCNTTWEAPIFQELGTWIYEDEDDLVCGDCGEDGVNVEEAQWQARHPEGSVASTAPAQPGATQELSQ